MKISKLAFPISVALVFILVFLARAVVSANHDEHKIKQSRHPNAADIGFAQDMAVHHHQAVEMSELAMRLGSDPIKQWGARISGIQLQEIGRFMGWLDIWNAPAIAANPMAWMHKDMKKEVAGHFESLNHSQHHHNDDIVIAMGMATADEMNLLASLRGKQFDILFLQLMIRHHQGGVLMAQAGINQANTYTVRNVCKVIAQGQTKEIFDMAMLLKAKGGELLPFGVPTPKEDDRQINHGDHQHHAGI